LSVFAIALGALAVTKKHRTTSESSRAASAQSDSKSQSDSDSDAMPTSQAHLTSLVKLT
jgi:hypothetical protein